MHLDKIYEIYYINTKNYTMSFEEEIAFIITPYV